MTARLAIPLLLAFAFPAAPQTAREMPPDQKAYSDAGKIADPEKKIEALQKLKAGFPDSLYARLADLLILSALTQHVPDQKDRIRKFAAEMYHDAPPKDRGAAANQIATALLARDLLLDDARGYARKALDSQSLAGYIRDQEDGYRERKQALPWTKDLEARYRTAQAARIATLGRIELKLGNDARARRLLEEAYVSGKSGIVEAALGQLAAKSGDDAKAMSYLIPAKLSGAAPKEASDLLAALYRKEHNGSLAGFDAMLDNEYHKRFPNPLEVPAYAPTAYRSDRVVLAEVFTGAGCGPCVAADLAFEAAMSRYARKDLAVVMYHEHIPRPDPMTNADTVARSKNYAVQGVPTFAIDGSKLMGGGDREQAQAVYDRFNPQIEKELAIPAEARLTADAKLSGNTVHITATVDGTKVDAKDLRLQILLLEKELRYSGENGIRFHPMVVRAMGGKEGTGFALDASTASFEQSFDIEEVNKAIQNHLDTYEAGGHRGETFTFSEKKDRIDRTMLAVVVFVQQEQSKHVLQSAYIDLGSSANRPSTTEAGNLR